MDIPTAPAAAARDIVTSQTGKNMHMCTLLDRKVGNRAVEWRQYHRLVFRTHRQTLDTHKYTWPVCKGQDYTPMAVKRYAPAHFGHFWWPYLCKTMEYVPGHTMQYGKIIMFKTHTTSLGQSMTLRSLSRKLATAAFWRLTLSICRITQAIGTDRQANTSSPRHRHFPPDSVRNH